MGDDDRLLTKTQLARYLAVSPRTIDRLDAARDLPRPILVAGRKRWRLSEIDEWLESKRRRV